MEVTIVEMMPGLLPGVDADLGVSLLNTFKKRGMTIYTEVKVNDLKVAGQRAVATLSNGQSIEADRVLVSVGRKPNTKDIGFATPLALLPTPAALWK